MGVDAPVMKLWFGVRAVEVGPADRVGGEVVAPIDVLSVDLHTTGVGRAGDEALVRVRAGEVGPADRAGAEVGPVDVARRRPPRPWGWTRR